MAATKTSPIYRTAYSGQVRHYAPTGNGMQEEFGYEINKYGQKVLVKTGETNLYAKIQEALEETKIENILKRVAVGDMSDFRPDGIYEDITEMPNSMLEARQQMQKLENLWAELPIEIKKKYNMDVEEFVSASGSEKWLKDMGVIKVSDAPKEEPKPVAKEEPTNE